jgi:hypothetical protein
VLYWESVGALNLTTWFYSIGPLVSSFSQYQF